MPASTSKLTHSAPRNRDLTGSGNSSASRPSIRCCASSPKKTGLLARLIVPPPSIPDAAGRPGLYLRLTIIDVIGKSTLHVPPAAHGALTETGPRPPRTKVRGCSAALAQPGRRAPAGSQRTAHDHVGSARKAGQA